jgi:hypothetical protein
VIQLADGLDGFLQLLVVIQPLANLRNLFAMDAELPVAAAGIADGQNRLRMAFTASAPGTAAGVMRNAIEERATQEFARGGKVFEEPLTSLDGLLVCHL